MEKLTAVQTDTLLAIHRFKAKHGYMPSYRELAHSMSVSNRCIQDRLERLKNKGYLTFGDRYQRRSMRFAHTVEYNNKQVPVLGTIN